MRRQYDAIHQSLGYRSFSIVRGSDVIELKRMLHRLKLLWPELADFPSRLDKTDLPEFNVEAAEAVDRFRKLHGLPVPADGLGHPQGLVDAAFSAQLKAAYYDRMKQLAVPAASESLEEKK